MKIKAFRDALIKSREEFKLRNGNRIFVLQTACTYVNLEIYQCHIKSHRQ